MESTATCDICSNAVPSRLAMIVLWPDAAAGKLDLSYVYGQTSARPIRAGKTTLSQVQRDLEQCSIVGLRRRSARVPILKT